MSKVAIVTDSNSGITQERGKELGIFVLPMPFFIDGELYLEDITLSQSEFYEKLGADSDISTSQTSPREVMHLTDKLLEEYDELVCIPMSSSLSSTCATAITLAAEYDGRVQVVDNQRISVTQEQSVLDAMNLREEGKSAAEIKEILEKEKLQASIYITVDTLKYLKKGGRITPAAAAIGTVLNLKPVLQIQGEKLDAFSKARGWKTAKKTMLNAIEKVNAKNIFILPNNKNIIMAANQAASLTEDKNIIVIPTKTIPQGITALVNYIPDSTPEDNAERMGEEIQLVKTGQVTYAVRDTVIDDKEIKQDDYMGIGDKGILSVGTDMEKTVLEMIGEMIDEDSAILSIYYGEEMNEDSANEIAEKVEEEYPDVEVEVHYGGQPIYYYVISVE